MNYEELKELAIKKSNERYQKTFEYTHNLIIEDKKRRIKSSEVHDIQNVPVDEEELMKQRKQS